MRGGRKQRRHHALIGFGLAVLLASCGSRETNSDNDLFQQATGDLRRGDFKTALSLAETGSALWQDKPQSPWYWKYRSVVAEALVNLGRAKDAVPLLEPRPPEGAEFSQITCRFKTVLAKALIALGRTQEAEATLNEAEACASSFQLKDLAPENQMIRYALFESLNRPQDAETAIQAAIERAMEQNDAYWQAMALNALGIRRSRGDRCDEAISILSGAEQGFRNMNSALRASVVQVNIASCASRLGDFDRALENYSSAIEIQEHEGAKPFLEASLGEAGNIYAFQENFAKAIPYYERALALALEISSFSDASKWAGNLAVAMTSVGNWAQAEKLNEQSREFKQRINDVDSQIHTVLISAGIAAGKGNKALAQKLFLDAVRAAQKKPSILWEAHAGLARLYRDAGDNSKASEHFEAAIRVIQASQAELTLPDFKITFLARLIRFYRDYVDALIDQKQFDKALQVVESSRARVLIERLGRGKSAGPTLSTVDYVRASQQSKTVFLSYWLGQQRSFLWVITPEQRKLFILPAGVEIEWLVKSYLTFIENLRDPIENAQPAAEHLYEVLIAPARELIPAGAKVVVVPDGALHNLNFEMLPVPGKPAHYWIEDVVLSVAPSLVVKPGSDSVAGLKSLLLIGNPEPAGADYAKLPNAADEMRSVERRMGALQKTIYEGPQAGPEAYRASNPQQFSLIHFAAHASTNSTSPMESAIILSPADNKFKLYARDVAQLPLQAELVTISACRGAGARVYSGEGLVGLTWAFLQAGARNVIAGLWDVTDLSTAQLMDRLYQSLSAGESPTRALREAKLSLIHSKGNFRKPYYWGPFQVYVGGGNAKGN